MRVKLIRVAVVVMSKLVYVLEYVPPTPLFSTAEATIGRIANW